MAEKNIKINDVNDNSNSINGVEFNEELNSVQNLIKKKCFNIKYIIFILISVIILLLGTTITFLILYLKISKNQNNNKIKDLELLNENLSNRIFNLEKENLKCSNNLNDYKTKYENLEVKVKDLELLNETFSNRISNLEKKNLECNNNLNEKKIKYENLEEKVKDLELVFFA